MKKLCVFFAVGTIIAIIIIEICSMRHNKISNNFTEYTCDVKNFNMATTIEIENESKEIAKVKGNLLRFIEDPLTMYDLNGNKLAYAGDAYHFIAQDSHAVYVNNEFSIEMVGKVDVLGETYEIYNSDKEKIAYAKFNEPNTYGTIHDTDGNLIAEYVSNFAFNDFIVRISDSCDLDHKSILMIFCSYYSDQNADR